MLTLEERRDEWRYQKHLRDERTRRLAALKALVEEEDRARGIVFPTTPVSMRVCMDSDVLPWPPCASHSWYRIDFAMAVCENCDYSAFAPSPIANDVDGYIPDDSLPNPPRPRLKARR